MKIQKLRIFLTFLEKTKQLHHASIQPKFFSLLLLIFFLLAKANPQKSQTEKKRK
jgi:hypothetical protein